MKPMLTLLTVLAATTVLSTFTLCAADGLGGTDTERAKVLQEFRRTGLSTTPGDALYLQIMVQASGARRGVEVGTERGFGAMHMGIAFERNGGHLHTIDIDPNYVKQARENIKKSGLEKTVTVIEGDALQELAKLEGEFDFVFIDALKKDYFKYFKILEPKLKKGALVLADNAIQSASQMKDFLDFMKASPNWEMVLIRASVEKNDGMAVCHKVK